MRLGEARPTIWRHKTDRMIGALCDLQLPLAEGLNLP
jgi:hypothetical protein